VNAVYERLLSQPEQATLPDVQHVWRSVSLSLWLRQIQGSPA
jgi:asparagine synthase (glutamine-hydrolysing)